MSLKIFNSSRFDTLFYDSTEAITGRPCGVRIGGGQIEVSYEDEGVIVKYVGFEAGPGHFNCKRQNLRGKPHYTCSRKRRTWRATGWKGHFGECGE